MRHRWTIPALVVLAAHAAPGGGAAQVTIGPTFDLSRPAYGERIDFTAGQTFTVPTEASFLSDFRFSVATWFNDTAPIFRLFVMDWDESAFAPVGDVLFRSAAQTGLAESSPGMGSSKRYEFSPGVSLSPGGTYIAFLSMHEDPQPPPSCQIPGRFCAIPSKNSIQGADYSSGPGTPYEGGMLVRATDYTSGTPREWRPVIFTTRNGSDALFSATFHPTSTVPEPASMALLGTGLAGLAGVANRRRRKREAAQG